MSHNSSFAYLEEQISKSIETLKSKVKVNKRKTYFCNALSIAMGAAITLCLGLDLKEELGQLQKNMALILGFILTVVNSWMAVFDYKKLWMRQKTTLLDLYQLMNELRYRQSQNEFCSIALLFEKYQSIWEKDGNEWRKIIIPSAHSLDNKNINKNGEPNGTNKN
ncbi:DUF4231 domain-containing protein [Pseudoalteromonas sp. SG43-1]|uniref:DUF4231 domain-containing protein n=1 Tax=Pseudoalteromonas sp. SG43-1 TaxID=2760971 RepID=UPI001601652A|nr:DUF4231 domain-containing protein [Pseudoalteromonas sp. SG43-1]MBB1452334.1 DUF4231 domain-containing protein [Pseudoalteromonas sp. SG43-1]